MRIPVALSLYVILSIPLFCAASLAQDDAAPAPAEPRLLETRAFEFDLRTPMPADRQTLWNALTGDVSGWWDHHFSETPAKLVVFPRPGGAFWEHFDADGATGAEHAEVIYAMPPERLVMTGPFGFSGNAVKMVVTYELEAVADEDLAGDLDRTGSILTVTVSVSGVYKDGWDRAARDVWRHFIEERLKGYLEAGCRGGGPCEDFK